MSKLTPKVSVVMSVYNGERYLSEAVESILNQTFTDFEFIIIDDGSTDSSWEIIRKYADQDQRVRLFKNEENLGLTKSLNKGIKLSKGEYIARQDADDISLPERFKKQVEFLDKHSEIVLLSSEVEYIDSEGNSLGRTSKAENPTTVAWHLLFHNYIGGHSQVMYRRQEVASIDGYKETFRYSQDYDLWLRLSRVGDLFILPEVLLKYRCFHYESISVRAKSSQIDYYLTATIENFKKMIGIELSRATVLELKDFWMGISCPDIDQVDLLHTHLKKIYHSFLQQDSPNSKVETSHRLRSLICKRFIWGAAKKDNPFSTWKVFSYAFLWDSSQAFEFVLDKTRRTLLHMFRRHEQKIEINSES